MKVAPLFLLVSVALTACGGNPPPPAKEFDPAVAERETAPQTLFDRGRMFAQVGDLTRAQEYLAAAIDRGADDREVFPVLVRVCVQSGSYRLALKYTEEHLRKHPNDIDALRILGTLFVAVGEGHRAEETLLRVVAATPNDADTHFSLGVLYRDTLKDDVRARARFRTYLQLAPHGKHAEQAMGGLGSDAGESR